MNLRKLYFSTIRKAKETPNIGEMYGVYCEEHHILPVSIYGQNKKIVVLTAREHVFVHHLLWRYFKKVWGEKHPRTIKMLYAYWYMIHRNGVKISSRTYQKLKEKYSKNMSIKMIGENNPFFGKKHSEETKKIIKEKRKNQPIKSLLWTRERIKKQSR